MRGLAICVLVGCSYDPARVGGAVDARVPGDDVQRLLDSTAGSEMLLDGGPVVASCDTPSTTGQIACYLFSDDLAGSSFDDGSANNLDAAQLGFTRVMRTPTEPAVNVVMAQSRAIVTQNALLDLPTAFTAAMWIRPTNPGSSSNQGLIDHNGQWAMSVRNGALSCWTVAEVSTSATMLQDEWQLVVCTWDGANICGIRISTSGSTQQGCNSANTPGATGNSGISLGSFQDSSSNVEDRFPGAIDDVRIYNRVLTSQELCVLAEQPSC